MRALACVSSHRRGRGRRQVISLVADEHAMLEKLQALSDALERSERLNTGQEGSAAALHRSPLSIAHRVYSKPLLSVISS